MNDDFDEYWLMSEQNTIDGMNQLIKTRTNWHAMDIDEWASGKFFRGLKIIGVRKMELKNNYFKVNEQSKSKRVE